MGGKITIFSDVINTKGVYVYEHYFIAKNMCQLWLIWDEIILTHSKCSLLILVICR